MEKNKYWQNKISLFLHDPICKALDIKSHESVAKQIADKLHQSYPVHEEYSKADIMASGLCRTNLPGYNSNEKYNGSIDFTKYPTITNTTSPATLELELPKIDIKKLTEEILNLLDEDLGLNKTYEELRKNNKENMPLNGLFDFNNNPEEWSKNLFMYLFFAFPKRLQSKNVGNLGALWDVLPADTRIPDHSIWEHVALTSAINSCYEKAPDGKINMVVFSITPVQGFIQKARKLRDSWTASVIISYLSFIGMSVVIDELGPDHILYPSLKNQTLVEKYLADNWHLEKYLTNPEFIKSMMNDTKSIASFPNKFVFLSAKHEVKTVVETIKKRITEKWLSISELVEKFLEPLSENKEMFRTNFMNQVDDYWTLSWASSAFVNLDDKDSINALTSLIPSSVIERNDIDEISPNCNKATAIPYGSNHSLVQSLLAAQKTIPNKMQKTQIGEKCPLCGEHEVLHSFGSKFESGNFSASDYSKDIDSFFSKMVDKYEETQIRTGEKLCAICSIKRFLALAINRNKKQIPLLASVFENYEKFPSTIELATGYFLKKSKKDKTLINRYLEAEEESLEDIVPPENLEECNKYYALLLMDGDKMGDLINGKTYSTTINDVIHPELKRRFENPTYSLYSTLSSRKNREKRRLMSPSLHASVSDALNNFSRFGVMPIIKTANGCLIYAGGDDVCAAMPLKNCLEAAFEIQKAYTIPFAEVKTTKIDGNIKLKKVDSINPNASKICKGLGESKGISISAAILIVHQKEALRDVISSAHKVLNNISKDELGRNACTIRLMKRSGGERDFSCKWDARGVFNESLSVWESFKYLIAQKELKKISSSFLYRIGQYKEEFLPLLDDIDLLRKSLSYYIQHTSTQKLEGMELIDLVNIVGNVVFRKNNGVLEFVPDGAIVANFMAGGEDNE